MFGLDGIMRKRTLPAGYGCRLNLPCDADVSFFYFESFELPVLKYVCFLSRREGGVTHQRRTDSVQRALGRRT